MDEFYFYHMVSFMTLCVVMILVYVFLSLYLKAVFRHLDRHMEQVNRRLDSIESAINKKGKL